MHLASSSGDTEEVGQREGSGGGDGKSVLFCQKIIRTFFTLLGNAQEEVGFMKQLAFKSYMKRHLRKDIQETKNSSFLKSR